MVGLSKSKVLSDDRNGNLPMQPPPPHEEPGDRHLPRRVLLISLVLAAAIGFAILYAAFRSASHEGVTREDIDQLLDHHQAELNERLLQTYPLGYALFYLSGDEFTVREGSRNTVQVDWKNLVIGKLYPAFIDLRELRVTMSNGITKTKDQVLIPRKHISKIRLMQRPLAIDCETVFITRQGELYVIGFTPQ